MRQELFAKRDSKVFAVPADFHSGWGDGYLMEKWLPNAKNLVDSDAALYEWLGICHLPVAGLDVSRAQRSPVYFLVS